MVKAYMRQEPTSHHFDFKAFNLVVLEDDGEADSIRRGFEANDMLGLNYFHCVYMI